MTKLDPIPGYVVKTSTLVGTKKKVFINICVDEQIPAPDIVDIPEITARVLQNNDWVVPIIVSRERSVQDKAGNPAVVFDCCMNPKVLLLGAQDPGIKVLVNETSIELVEDATGYELDRSYSVPRMKSKGELEHTEFSAEDFNRKPKALEDIIREKVGVDNSVAVEKPQASQKPAIEILETHEEPAMEPQYSIKPYNRGWSGEGRRPDFEVTVSGEHEVVKPDNVTLTIDEIKIDIGVSISRVDPVYITSENLLYVFVWKTASDA